MVLEDNGGMIITLALMFFGALGAGYLPYSIKVRESRLLFVSALGGGLLLGSALAVVIPEGFHAFHEASPIGKHVDHSSHEEHDHSSTGHLHSHEDHADSPPSGLTGLALVAGFMVMLLLDQLQASSEGHSHHHHHHHHLHVNDEDDTSAIATPGAALAPTSAGDPSPAASREPLISLVREPETSVSGHVVSGKGAKGSSSGAPGGSGTSSADRAVTGLLVHCASDGLAMGSAFLSGNATLSFVVGAAMVLHKAPMAFGLTSYLLSARCPWPKAQRTLLIFSATAPASSLLTYTLLRALPMFTTPLAVSLAILFSGGTFLHAATMHILPDVVATTGHLNAEQLTAVGLGCVIPALLSWGHHH